jgi:hypothetical protein
VNHLAESDRARARAYIEARSIPVPHCGCRLWLLAPRSNGYGAATFNGEQWTAHCLAYEAWVGPVPDGALLEHRICDERMCCEWTHLRPGSIASNMDDAARKLRLGQKLNAVQVRAIRERYGAGGVISLRRLALEYRVSKTSIAMIVRREHWSYA